jgi:undecaprenyl-diphosphatase
MNMDLQAIIDIVKNIDWSILHLIQNNLRTDILDQIFPIITRLGDMGAVWIVLSLILLIPRRTRRTAVLMLIGMAAAYILGAVMLKNYIARPRPCWLDDSVVLLITEPKDYSFPSGHTLAGTVACFLINRTNKVIGFFAVILMLLIAFSRMYLYVHFPSDVLAGLIIGIIFGAVTWLIGGRWAARGRLPKEPDFWENVI